MLTDHTVDDERLRKASETLASITVSPSTALSGNRRASVKDLAGEVSATTIRFPVAQYQIEILVAFVLSTVWNVLPNSHEGRSTDALLTLPVVPRENSGSQPCG